MGFLFDAFKALNMMPIFKLGSYANFHASLISNCWVLFFGFINTHQRYANSFKGESQNFLSALHTSVLLGTLVGLGLLVYYFIHVSWYWPFVLFFLSSFVGGILFGTLDAKINPLILSIACFLAWPLAALWVFYVIRNLQPLPIH